MSTMVREILAEKGPQVYSIGPDANVFEALGRLSEHDVGALLVLDGGAPVGVFSERDYARKVILQGRASRDTRIVEVMSSPVITVGIDASVQRCMARMTRYRIRHLPVVDESGELAGMVSIGDLLKATIAEQEFEIDGLQSYIAGTE